MSPEQALARRGVVDQRTDIYALGLTLYELLALRPAFDGRDHHELLRQIAVDEPVSPRRFNKAVPRDLETIIMKAICKEPSSRYSTARELADDLTRFCEDRPIQARRPTVLERGRRWARRHRQIVVTAVTVMGLALAVGATLIGLQIRETNLQVQKTNTLSQERLTYIRDSFPLIDEIVMQYMGEASAKQSPAMPGQKQHDSAIDVYQQALKLYEQASKIPPADFESRKIIARSFHRMGFTRGVTWFRKQNNPTPDLPGLLAQAESDYRHSIKLFDELLAEQPGDPEVRSWIADAFGMWGYSWFLDMIGRREEAKEVIRGLAKLAKRQTEPETRRALVAPISGYGIGLLQQNKREDAADIFGLAVEIDPDNANLLNNMAWSQASFPDSPAYNPTKALEAARKAVTLAPKNGLLWNTMGVAAYRTGDLKTASEALEKSLSMNKGGDANDWFFLAMTRWRQNNKAEARKWFDEAVAWTKKNSPDNPELKHFQKEAALLLESGTPSGESKPEVKR
jgi:tetratricopeptide (TPR) repeat protein